MRSLSRLLEGQCPKCLTLYSDPNWPARIGHVDAGWDIEMDTKWDEHMRVQCLRCGYEVKALPEDK